MLKFLLVYLEFLVRNNFSPSHIANDLAGIKAHFVYHSLPVGMFDDLKIKYFIRSLRLDAPLSVTIHKVIDTSFLKGIVTQCDSMYMGQIFKSMYLLAFFSFLRLSNLVPHTKNQFSPLKHLTPGDILLKITQLSYS